MSGDVDEVALAGALVGDGLTGSQHPDRGVSAVAGYLGGCHHHGAAAVGDDAAVHQVQRVGDDAGTDHVFDGDGIAEQRLGVHGGVMPHGHRDLGQLLGGGAVEVHVPTGDHGVEAHGGHAVELLEAIGGRLQDGMAEASDAAGSHGHAAGAGEAAVGDDGHIDPPGRDGGKGVGEVELEGPAADGGVVDVAGVQVKVVGQVHAAVAGTAGSSEQAVDVVLGEAGVGEGVDDALALDLEFALIGSVAGDVLVDAHDGGGAPEVNHGGGTSVGGWGAGYYAIRVEGECGAN